MPDATKRALVIVAAILAVPAVIGVGSYVYWRADGSVGTPQNFTDRVAEAGLDVEWSNAGPRAGDGVVRTDCGPVEVTVNDLDGALWLTTPDQQRRLTASTIEELISCADS
jgi:hypothetical protein